MKKKLITIGIIVIALITIFIVWIFNQPYSESIWNMVLENEEDYTSTALIYYEDFQQQDEDILRYSEPLSNSSTIGKIFCYDEQDNIREIVLNETETTSALSVYESYLLDDHFLTGVVVYDGFVSFCNQGGRESLVYSIDGTRPSYLRSPDENYDRIWVHKITDNWYHISGTKSSWTATAIWAD